MAIQAHQATNYTVTRTYVIERSASFASHYNFRDSRVTNSTITSMYPERTIRRVRDTSSTAEWGPTRWSAG
jgi:hypothetical protein